MGNETLQNEKKTKKITKKLEIDLIIRGNAGILYA
jgi:hypothetical protein